MANILNIDLDEYIMDLHEVSHTIVNGKSIEVAAYYPFDQGGTAIFFVIIGEVKEGFTFMVENSIHPTIKRHEAFTELGEALSLAINMVREESIKV